MKNCVGSLLDTMIRGNGRRIGLLIVFTRLYGVYLDQKLIRQVGLVSTNIIGVYLTIINRPCSIKTYGTGLCTISLFCGGTYHLIGVIAYTRVIGTMLVGTIGNIRGYLVTRVSHVIVYGTRRICTHVCGTLGRFKEYSRTRTLLLFKGTIKECTNFGIRRHRVNEVRRLTSLYPEMIGTFVSTGLNGFTIR